MYRPERKKILTLDNACGFGVVTMRAATAKRVVFWLRVVFTTCTVRDGVCG